MGHNHIIKLGTQVFNDMWFPNFEVLNSIELKFVISIVIFHMDPTIQADLCFGCLFQVLLSYFCIHYESYHPS